MPDPICPTEAELTAFASGHLPAAKLQQVADHARSCAACEQRLAQLDRQDNSILAALSRRPVPADVPGGQQTTVVKVAPAPDPRARPAGRPAPWQFGSGTHLESEIRDLLHFRLRVGVLVALVVFSFFLLEHLVEPLRNSLTLRAWDWRDQGLLLLALVVYASGAAVLWRWKALTLPRLRLVELILFGASLAYLAGARYLALTTAGAELPADAVGRRLAVEHALLLSNMAWYFALLAYGLFIPNTWRRCVTVLAGFAVIPLALTPLAARVNPVVAAHLPMLVAATAIGVFLSGALAVFGSFKFSTLQQEAFVARQEARELGQYRLTRQLGEGGMGEVYLAEHRLLKRACAIKLLRPQHAGDPDYLRRFEREVQATARLNHPNTVEIYDYGHAEDGTFYYVMEYLPGLTLDDLVKRHGPLPPARAVHLLRQLCSALRAAHGIGLIHRDIKPGNVMLARDGTPHDRVKLLDFGLVRPVDRSPAISQLTQEGMVIGTPEYMSPEQVEGDTMIDVRSDLYSLGGLAYFLLTGQPPFLASSVMQILIAHLQAPVPAVRMHAPEVADDLETVVSRCLAKLPEDRFPNAGSLDRALAACACAGQWTEEQAAVWWQTHAGNGT
jgi:eukaryotic-like serine/threonine-protein kinase